MRFSLSPVVRDAFLSLPGHVTVMRVGANVPVDMPDSGSPSAPFDSAGYGRQRLVFVVCCLVAVITGGVLVASVGSGGLAGSPIDSVLPGEDVSADQVSGEGPLSGSLGEVQGLGSLRPGSQTGAGGEIRLDNGTFASTDTAIHFTARSSQPTYWRTAAFGNYTGAGWGRTTETRSYDPPLYDDGVSRVEYNVTLNQTATALPTPWRPTAVDGIDADSLVVRGDGSVEPSGPLPNGTTFTGVSQQPPGNPAVLRAANDSTPADVERYTELPEDTAPRLAAQTGNIVADAEGRYETAEAVKDWLRGAKRYSLEAYRDTDSVAETFVFEMEAGYCEYYATAMAAMLRTQDIPTRYVLGYTSGQQVADDTYQVRGMNAHAWVEVYFDGVGWVQFDPTPGGPRLERQEQALSAIGEEYNVTDPASPDETFDLDDDDDSSNSTETDLSLELNRTAVPGAPVEVTVTRNETPVEGVTVAFDGRPVGQTDFVGAVTGTVPDTEEFVISVRRERDRLDTGNDSESLVFGGGVSLPGRLAAGVGTVVQRQNGTEDETRENSTDRQVYNETVDVTTEADVELVGNTIPGNEVGVNVVVGNDPLGGARVSVDGEVRARTDDFGYTSVVLPSTPGPTTVAVEGTLVAGQQTPLTGEQTVDLPALTVETDVDWPVAVPLAPTTVEASYGEEPAVGVPVEVNGEQVATTGADGQATVRLPFDQSAEITAGQYGLSDGTTTEGQLTRLALLLGGLLFAGVVVLLLSSADLLSRLARAVRGRFRRLGGLAATALVAVAGRSDSLLGRVGARIGDTLRLVLVALGLAEPAADTGPDWPDGQDGPVAVAGGEDQVTDERARVRAAWGRFLAQVSAPAATHTPGELAAHAIEQDGLPAEPVRTLRDAFRAVEYGSRPARPDRVRAAIEAIEGATDRPEEEQHRPSGGDD
jgi:transglutaminase-like putative cysteine protease